MIEDIDYPSEKTLREWPNCIVKGCKNKCCKSLKSDKCYPHTFGLPADTFVKGVAREVTTN